MRVQPSKKIILNSFGHSGHDCHKRNLFLIYLLKFLQSLSGAQFSISASGCKYYEIFWLSKKSGRLSRIRFVLISEFLESLSDVLASGIKCHPSQKSSPPKLGFSGSKSISFWAKTPLFSKRCKWKGLSLKMMSRSKWTYLSKGSSSTQM